MRIIKLLLSISILLMLLISCATTGSETFETLEYNDEQSHMVDVDVNISPFVYFISAPYDDLYSHEDLAIASLEIPQKETRKSDESRDSQAKEERTVQVPHLQENKKISEVETPINNNEKINVLDPHEIEQLDGFMNEEFVLHLEGEGWIFENPDSNSTLKLKSRYFEKSRTVFVFDFLQNGFYSLNFNLQNLTNGSFDRKGFKVNVQGNSLEMENPAIIEPLENPDQILDAESRNTDLITAVQEQHIPGIIASFDDLIDDENILDVSTMLSAFDLLKLQGGYNQYLLILAEKSYELFPYDNISAEMLFSVAQMLESPGPEQNVEKALDIFKLLRDRFPISIYSDKSEERIRYLERHFIKIY